MRRGGGKAKGSAFERMCCKQLSLWVTAGKNQDAFWRSAMSGGRATVAARSGVLLRRQAGDISAVAPEGHQLTSYYYIECKFVRSLDIEAFLFRGKGKLALFWKTACTEAKRHKLKPLIIARQNRCPDLLIGPPAAFNALVPLLKRNGMCLRVERPKQETCEIRLLSEVLAQPFWTGAQ